MAQASNLWKFSNKNLIFQQFTKVFSCKSFLIYDYNTSDLLHHALVGASVTVLCISYILSEFDHCYCAKLMDWGYSSFMKWKVSSLSWYAIPPPLHAYHSIGIFCGHEIFPILMVELILRKYYFHSYTHACGSHIPSVRENLIHDCNSTFKSFFWLWKFPVLCMVYAQDS